MSCLRASRWDQLYFRPCGPARATSRLTVKRRDAELRGDRGLACSPLADATGSGGRVAVLGLQRRFGRLNRGVTSMLDGMGEVGPERGGQHNLTSEGSTNPGGRHVFLPDWTAKRAHARSALRSLWTQGVLNAAWAHLTDQLDIATTTPLERTLSSRDVSASARIAVCAARSAAHHRRDAASSRPAACQRTPVTWRCRWQ
jgi:hypothetical protein